MAADAIATVLSTRPGPATWPGPSEPEPDEVVVVLPPLLAAKAALWSSMKEAGLTNSELGRRIGVSEGAVGVSSTSGTARTSASWRSLAALGERLVVAVRDAA